MRDSKAACARLPVLPVSLPVHRWIESPKKSPRHLPFVCESPAKIGLPPGYGLPRGLPWTIFLPISLPRRMRALPNSMSRCVTLERSPDDAETLSFIFRLVHTIKGTCGFLGLPRLERVAHAGENVLGKLRDRTLTVTPDIVSQVLAAIDRDQGDRHGPGETGAEPAGDDADLIAALNATPPIRPPVDFDAVRRRRSHRCGSFRSRQPLPRSSLPPSSLPCRRLPSALRPAAPVAGCPCRQRRPDRARRGRRRPCCSGSPLPQPPAAPAAGAQTIRVTVDVLEDLMTLVSELVLTRNQLLQLARNQESSAFTVPLQRLSHITSDLQEGVMKTRMQPIGNAWNKLPRLVRDLSHDMGKKIELTMLGAETELDRQVLELIKDPLTHMIRNSGDHGLETPAERRCRRQAGDRQYRAERLSRGRLHHHGDLRRRPRPRG